ncbi:MAG: response regulator transcription factor [Halieaceae bacterium]|nr:response regulator transcription factor [Halieaceae bacterium]
MSKLRVLIVDDEAPARRKLRRQLSEIANIEVIGEAKDGQQALSEIEQKRPDLILLDIQMPGMTGFDVLRLLEPPPPDVIFVTAFDKYAIKAFEVSATDYLLKPVSDERLSEAVGRASAKVGKTTQLLDALEPQGVATRIAVRYLKRVKLLAVTDISYITSEHRVVYVVDRRGQKHWTNESLDQLMKRLDPNMFFRIHRSSILNLSAPFEIEPWEDGRLKIHLPDQTTLTVARDPATTLRQKLNF